MNMVTALIAMSVGVLMVHAGVAKRQLASANAADAPRTKAAAVTHGRAPAAAGSRRRGRGSGLASTPRRFRRANVNHGTEVERWKRMFDRAAKISRTQVTKMRWVLGLHGLASVVFGVMILAWPGISVYALTIVFGAYTLATGIVEFGTAFTAQGKEERGWLILRGLLGITVGVLVFAWPGISALALLYVIGAYAVGLGILCVGASFQLPLDGRDTTAMVLTGLVSIVFGIVIFAKPGAGALAVLALIAAFALVTGVSELVVAIGGEKLLERKAKKTFSPPPTQAKTTPQPSH